MFQKLKQDKQTHKENPETIRWLMCGNDHFPFPAVGQTPFTCQVDILLLFFFKFCTYSFLTMLSAFQPRDR